jgi:hypothetical protein
MGKPMMDYENARRQAILLRFCVLQNAEWLRCNAPTQYSIVAATGDMLDYSKSLADLIGWASR